MSKGRSIKKIEGSTTYTYVFFGGVMSGFGMPLFEFKRMAELNSIDCLIIRDLTQSWYTCNHQEILQELNKEILHNNRKYIFVGNSMGGFAAIKYGIIFGIERIITFSPQYSVNPMFKFIHLDLRWSRILVKKITCILIKYRHSSLKSVLRNNSKSFIEVHFGRKEPKDKFHASMIKKYNHIGLTEIIEYENSSHSLVKDLNSTHNLIPKILKYEK